MDLEEVERIAAYAATYVVSRTTVFPNPSAIVIEAARLTALHYAELAALAKRKDVAP